MGAITLRKTIPEICALKERALKIYANIDALGKEASDLFEELNGYSFYRIDQRDVSGVTNEEAVDRICWRYLVNLANLERFMLCTDYSAMQDQIEEFQTPAFNEENARAWLLSLKSQIHESVQKLIETVFERITTDAYWTGSGYSSRQKKKRNNNGIDQFFILHTNDRYEMNWCSRGPTITDDLEKACYIINGKDLPDETIKNMMRREKRWESENPYFRIRVCSNGNTHYWLNNEIRERLNFYGSKRGVFGSNIKIKILDE